jgi:hypothetical protein
MHRESKLVGPLDFVVFRGVRELAVTVAASSVFFTHIFICITVYLEM